MCRQLESGVDPAEAAGLGDPTAEAQAADFWKAPKASHVDVAVIFTVVVLPARG